MFELVEGGETVPVSLTEDGALVGVVLSSSVRTCCGGVYISMLALLQEGMDLVGDLRVATWVLVGHQ